MVGRRGSIWDEMRRMQEEMDSLFDQFLTREPLGTMLPSSQTQAPATGGYRQPLSDMWETDDEIVATLEVPGVDKEDIDVTATDNGIEVKVESKSEEEQEDEDKNTYRYERRYSGFYRYIRLPEAADTDNIDASYKNGVLELRIPKKEEVKEKTKKIEVK